MKKMFYKTTLIAYEEAYFDFGIHHHYYRGFFIAIID